MLSKKEMSLMDFLMKQRSTFVSSEDIGHQLGMSDRTVRKYLSQLSDTIVGHGASIISKRGYGYQLAVDDQAMFELFWQNLLAAKRNVKDVLQIEEAEDRKHYILNKLFFEDKQQSLKSLAKELFISRTTLNNVLSLIRESLLPYGLTLLTNKQMITVLGSEADMRRFIMDYFFVNSFDESMSAMVEHYFVSTINFPELTIFVIDECRNANLKLSDFIIQNLVLHIALMLQRIRLGYPLKSFNSADVIESSEEYRVAKRILKRVEEAYGISFPKEEANYIALHLTVKNSSVNPATTGFSTGLIEYHLKEKFVEASQLIAVPFYLDNDLLNGLTAHMTPLLSRLKNKIQMTNPLTEQLKQDYPAVFEMTKHVFKDMPELSPYQVTDDEWAYITLHLMAAIERYSNKNKLNVLVVCATGYGSALMLKNRLEKEFGGSLQIVDAISYYELSEKRLQSIDLIISSISLSNLMFLTPVINVSVFLNNEDIARIRSYLSEEASLSYNSREQKKLSDEKACQIADEMFVSKRFFYFEQELSKAEVLETMVNSLEESRDDQFVEQFLKQMELRESYSPIVYGNTLAFPHPSSAMSLSEQVVVGIFKQPLQWNEEHYVSFIFLLSPSKGSNPYLKHLSPSLVDFVEQTDLQEQLLASPTVNNVKKIFIPLIGKH
ncbi:BglG family transcription antiterminator [Streptococcus jiangjianxini]|uniref:BglG family transcription antiterminator n=1 Tax=Streptococcus jiangjianxini TaxID=3161189 RepID=UPI0032EC242D